MAMNPAPLIVRRWKRYGHDRLYVDNADGTTLGWLSLTTGELTIAVDEDYDEVFTALRGEEAATPWLAEFKAQPTASPAAVEPFGDLANNRPGAAVRARANHELDEMRGRSRLATAVVRVFGVKTDERAWRKGAEGEEAVGPRLERLLKDGWRVLHSVPVGKSDADIDHLLIGPGGVYTINTKLHPGKRIWVGANSVRVNGHSVSYLRNARFEAQRASRLLSTAVARPVEVRPVIVFLTGSLVPNVTVKERPADVLILDRMDIPRAFKRAPQRLEESDVTAIFEAARRPGTWK